MEEKEEEGERQHYPCHVSWVEFKPRVLSRQGRGSAPLAKLHRAVRPQTRQTPTRKSVWSLDFLTSSFHSHLVVYV